jgi:hypothetical protein
MHHEEREKRGLRAAVSSSFPLSAMSQRLESDGLPRILDYKLLGISGYCTTVAEGEHIMVRSLTRSFRAFDCRLVSQFEV